MKSSERQFHLVYVVALLLSISLNFIFVSRDGEQVKQLASKMQDSLGLVSPPKRIRKTNETFAACMLVMDDNHRLTEWLAYHYHVLPLDYLVVGVDPNSKTSPTPIFDKWRRYGMKIVEWNNTDIFKGMLWEYDNIVMKRSRMPHDHRQRQNMFLRNCLAHMRQVHRTWVLLVDSDEYLLFNGPSRTHRMRPTYPSIRNKATIIEYLHEDRQSGNGTLTKSPCVAIPRILFGSKGGVKEYVDRPVPEGFKADSFDTMRYRKHLKRHKTVHDQLNGWAKTIIDVSRLHDSDIMSANDSFRTNPYQLNVHQPLPKVCPEPFIRDIDSVFRINHYVGSWEAFSYRTDARAAEGRDKAVSFEVAEVWFSELFTVFLFSHRHFSPPQKWKTKADVDEETDDAIREWLGGFVEEHGQETASEMLREAGKFTPKPKLKP